MKDHAVMGIMACGRSVFEKECGEMKTKRMVLLCALGAAIVVLLFLFLPRPVSLLLSGPLDEVNHMGLSYTSTDADNRFQDADLTEEQADRARAALEGMVVWYSPDFSHFAGWIPVPNYELLLFRDDAANREEYGKLTFDQRGYLYKPNGARYRILSGGEELLAVLQACISE